MLKREVQLCVVGYLSRRRDECLTTLDSVPYRSRRYESALLELDEIEGLLSDLGVKIRAA